MNFMSLHINSGLHVFLNFFIICCIRLAFAGVYRRRFAAVLPRPLLARIVSPKWLSPPKIRKLHENIFYAIWHTMSFCLILSHVTSESWFFEMIATGDPRYVFDGWPHFVDAKVQGLYLGELGFWVSCAAFMMVETSRKDATELFVHHVATIVLIGLSYTYNYFRIGFVVLLIHDVGDIFLYWAKSFHYLNWHRTTNILFILFVSTFVIFRLVLFPLVVRTAWGVVTGYLHTTGLIPGCYILPTMLTVLQILHWIWFALIVRMVARMARNKRRVDGDIRSDEDLDPDVSSRNAHTKSN